MTEAWVFDVDDTLYLERDYVASGFRAVGQWLNENHGVDGFGDRCWALFEAGARNHVFNEALASSWRAPNPELISQLVTVYRDHEPDIRLSPQVARQLEDLAGSTSITLLTGGPVKSQQRKVAALGLARFTEAVVYAGAWGPEFDKPHPRAWQRTEGLTRLTGPALTYVADNPLKDFAAPRSLGWHCIRIRLEGSQHQALETPPGVAEILALSELPNPTG